MALQNVVQTFSFPGDTTSYTVPSWTEMTDGLCDIATAIRASGKDYQVIVTLAKGGLPLSRILADFLHIPTILSLGVRFYTGIGEHLREPVVYQEILHESIADKAVLLFDDIADTGASLDFGKRYLHEKGAAEITTVTLYTKPQSHVQPAYSASSTDSWVIFPFELNETVRRLHERWKSHGVEYAERVTRLESLGLRHEWILEY